MPTVQAQGTTGLSQADIQAQSGARLSYSTGDVLGAIHNIPLEVLREIFLRVPPPDLQLHNNPHVRRNRRTLINPFLLCSICSMWRALALATPQLWRRVFIYIPSPTPTTTNAIGYSRPDVISQWIQRSGSLPLTLYLTYDCSSRLALLDETGPVARFVNVLTRYATRWEAFYLQSLRQEWTFHELRKLFCLNGRSSLRHVSLHETGSKSTNTTIPWAQLTHLAINVAFSFYLAVDILEECRELKWLSISVHERRRLSGPPLILPDLVTLHLTTCHNLGVIVNSISLPSLRGMFVSRLVSDEDEVESLLIFFTRSACALDKLEIRGNIFEEGNLVPVLAHRCCNSLTSLTIHGRPFRYNPIEEEFFERLSLNHDNLLCPNLKLLKLERYQVGYASSSAALLGMVKSRTGFPTGDGRFHFLYLEMKDFAHEHELEEIIKGSGMDYTLCREPENSVTKCKVWLDGRTRF